MKRLKILLSIALTFAIFLLLPIFINADPVERVVAKVNDDIITLSDFEKYAESFIKNGFIQNKYSDRLSLLEVLIEYELIDQIGRKYSILVIDSDVEERVNAIISMNNIPDRETFEKILIQQNVSPSIYAYKKEIKKSLILEKLAYSLLETDSNEIEITKPTAEEIKKAYEENISLFSSSGERKISHIVISAGTTAKEYREAQKLSETIIEKVKNGEASFEELAKQYSKDNETKDQGGNLGYFTKQQLKEKYPFYVDSVFSSEKGDLKIIVTTEDVVVVYIMDVKEGRTQSFSEVYNMIRTNLFFGNFQKEFPTYLNRYRENSRIEVLL